MPHETTAWQCNFCHRCFNRKVDACNHECTCKYNPARRMCFTCKHFDKKGEFIRTLSPEDVEIRKEFWGDESTTERYVAMKCNHFDVPMSEQPYFMECDFSGYEGREDKPTPGTCFYWEPRESEVE